MMNLISQARPAVDKLDGFNESRLYEELGARLRAVAKAPTGSDQFNMSLSGSLESYGLSDELEALGKKFFARWKQQAFELMCGSAPGDADAREQISNAFGLGRE